MDKILVIAAHPDDETLGCGGFLSKYANKDIRVIFIAEGTSCRFNLDKLNSQEVADKIIERNSYCINALSTFGISDIKFYNYPCGRLDDVPIIDINKIIESEIRDFKPQTVLTHSEFDNNNDHRIVYRSTIMATRPGVFKDLYKVISYEVPSTTEWSFSEVFQPNFFEVLEKKHVEKKWEALKLYETETFPYPHPRSYEGIFTLSRYRGMQAGVEFSEAYRIIRSINK
jgi:LmbE family N-acetylglucosaminyl deacetylase